MLAVPLRYPHRLRGAVLGTARQPVFPSWDLVQAADRANLGLCIDSFHVLAHGTDLEVLRISIRARSSSCSCRISSGRRCARRDERIETARHYRVFPGEGVHSDQLAEMVRAIDEMGYRGDYSFEVFNDDYRQLPLPMVCRARAAVGEVDHGARIAAQPAGASPAGLTAPTPARARRRPGACAPP